VGQRALWPYIHRGIHGGIHAISATTAVVSATGAVVVVVGGVVVCVVVVTGAAAAVVAAVVAVGAAALAGDTVHERRLGGTRSPSARPALEQYPKCRDHAGRGWDRLAVCYGADQPCCQHLVPALNQGDEGLGLNG